MFQFYFSKINDYSDVDGIQIILKILWITWFDENTEKSFLNNFWNISAKNFQMYEKFVYPKAS